MEASFPFYGRNRTLPQASKFIISLCAAHSSAKTSSPGGSKYTDLCNESSLTSIRRLLLYLHRIVPQLNKPLQQNYIKATTTERGPPRYSHNWSLARRAIFKVYSNRLEIGPWTVRFDEIREIILYQIGFNPWVNPIKNIPLKVQVESVRLGYSPFSVVVPVAVMAFIAYWLWEAYGGSL
jgi:hypothetical protein